MVKISDEQEIISKDDTECILSISAHALESSDFLIQYKANSVYITLWQKGAVLKIYIKNYMLRLNQYIKFVTLIQQYRMLLYVMILRKILVSYI